MLTMSSVFIRGKNYVNDCGHFTSVTQGLAVENLRPQKSDRLCCRRRTYKAGALFISVLKAELRSAWKDGSSCDL